MHTHLHHTETIKAGEFKAHCLELMDVVNHEKKEFIITKRGVPVAKLVPIIESEASPFGYLKDTVVYMEDIISPVDLKWSEDPETE